MITLSDIWLSFGEQDIFNGISITINKNDKIGLIGKNGVGKSTLLKILAGEISPEKGTVNIAKNLKIGYLPQHLDFNDDTTVFNETLKAFEQTLKLQKEFDELNEKIQNCSDYSSEKYHKILERFNFLAEKLQILEVNKIEQYTSETLKGLGFEEKDFQRKTSEFSGGWRMRIEIAKLLLQNPDILLLDEPTNHLDINSIQWLEDFLTNYKGAIVLISHDKRFLDKITNRTIEITKGKILDFNLPYSEYKELRKQIIEHQKAKNENLQKKIKQTERFIERFRYKATKASQVQSRIKMLEKLEFEDIIEEDTKTINLKFPPAPRSGDIVVEIKDLSKSFGEKSVLEKINLTIQRNEKVAFVGRNGEGKTTLSRIIVGELDFNEGKIKIGHNVKIGYFPQNSEHLLNPQKTVLETLQEVAPIEYTEAKLRGILGAFLFSNDDVLKKVSVLSGGEKTRLALARLVLQPYNFLILDEPTNHLDIYAKDVLKQALKQFDGTLLVISHDRDFLQGLTQVIYEFSNKKIKQYKGDIDYFLSKKKAENFFIYEKQKSKPQKTKSASKEKSVSKNKIEYLQKKEKAKQIRKLKNKIKNLENEIEILEIKINELEEKFRDPSKVNDDDYRNYEIFKQNLKEKMELWQNFYEELEKTEQK